MKKLLMLLVFFFLFFSAAQFLRPFIGNPSMIGSTTYFHYRGAEMLANGQSYDPLSFGGRDYTYPPGFHYLLALTMVIWPILLPIIGVLGVALCYYFARQLGFTDEEALFSSAMLGFISGFIYLAGHLNPRLPALIFLVFSFMLLMKKTTKAKALAGLSLAAVLYFHPLVGGIGLAFGAILFRKRLKDLAVPYCLALALFFLWFLPFIASHGLPQTAQFYSQYVELQSGIQFFVWESALVSDSISFIMLLIAIYGLFAIKEKETRFVKEWLILSVIVALIFGNRLNEQLLFPVALLSGKVISSYFSRLVKSVRLDFLDYRWWKVLLLTYIALVGVLAAGSLLFFPPSADEYSAMTWIKLNTPSDSVVFAPWFEGHWVSGVAMRKNVIDAYAEYAPNIDERFRDTKQVFFGSDIGAAIDALKKYNASYVYYRLGEENTELCGDFPYLTGYGYFDLVFSQGQSYVFKIDYSGKSEPARLCSKTVSR